MAVLFPKWTNKLPGILLLAFLLLIGFVVYIFWYWFSPYNLDVGYQPDQPIPYSHKLHAGDLGIDCRYCHVNVESSRKASIPSSEICMNCHALVKTDRPSIVKLRESYASGTPIEWNRVHLLPDYVYFDHSRHVNSGVSCVECHGRVDRMRVVRQVEPLSMGWCLDCHRNPAPHLRPKDKVTQLDWQPEDPYATGVKIQAQYHVNPGEDCSLCHR